MSIRNNIEKEKKYDKPALLKILCILTFIGSGVMFFSNLIIYLNYQAFIQVISSGQIELPGADIMLKASKTFFLASLVFYMTSVAGAYLMWELKKTGFHIYTVSQILILLLPVLFDLTDNFSFPALIFSTGFIVLYATNLKAMR